MKLPELAARQRNQLLTKPAKGPVDVVRAMLAMQAQEYWAGLWAVGLRTKSATERSVEEALARGDILRSHPMRGTHHLVAREDLRWLMALMGPLMIERHGTRMRGLGLDEKTLSKAMRTLQKALEGGRARTLTRSGVAHELSRVGISSEGQRLPHLIYRAELESLVCSGPRLGSQDTVALFDERVPAAKPHAREEALAELARRYFATRAPATVADFAWWCGLPMGDVRTAIELAGVDVDAPPAKPAKGPRAFALPPYDEYTVAYRDRSAIGVAPMSATGFMAKSLLGPGLVLDGEIVGQWARKGKKVSLELWRKLGKADTAALEEAAQRWVAFTSP